MNINNAQMKAIRCLISKNDKEYIAQQTDKSVRTVEAVLNYDRNNNEIEEQIFKVAQSNHAQLSRTLATIQSQNLLPLDFETFEKFKNSPQWANDERFQRYNDIYLRLCHYKFTEYSEIWEIFKKDYKDIITSGFYCCDLLARLTGTKEIEAVQFFNQNI